ncbi:MAG: type I 3-dehydroquinate dehydratase [Chitinophagales bacterium]|nr:type I 3-dehydroquinate dehydratase [Sphingobacteriales bacterium]
MRPCVIFTESNIKRAISIAEKFSIAEVRMDLCQFRSQYLSEIFSLPIEIIATYREADSTNASVQKMEQLKKAMSAGASFIDVELMLNSQQRDDLISFAKGYGVKVIISYHNFDKTPSQKELKEIIDQSRQIGADIVKIATKVNFRDDCLNLLNLYQGEENIVAFGMGEDAKFTRITSLFLGAPFTYVHYISGSKTAEGQIGYKEFEAIIENL